MEEMLFEEKCFTFKQINFERMCCKKCRKLWKNLLFDCDVDSGGMLELSSKVLAQQMK